MKKTKGLTWRAAAMLLAGMLAVGACPGSVPASETQLDMGQSSETAAGDVDESSPEDISNEEYSEDTALTDEEIVIEEQGQIPAPDQAYDTEEPEDFPDGEAGTSNSEAEPREGSTVCVPAMAAEVTGEEQVVLQEEGTKQEEDLETESTADSETEGETTELPEDLESGEKTANAAENVIREAAEPGEQDDKPENAAGDVTTSAAEPEEPGAAEAAEGKQPEIASTDIQESSGAGNTEIIAGTDAAVQEDKYLPIVIVDGVTDGTSDVAYGASATWDAENLSILQIFGTDVSTASNGCMMMGLPGEYIGDQQAILDRINAIRREACEQNIINPETGRPLTMDDYVPLKWSHELEEIARIRAAETSMTADHIRTNGGSWQSVDSEFTYVGECVAWNYDSSATAGIDQWYNEKENWMNGDENGSGHYTTLIRPSMRYVGGATFYSPCTEYPNTTLVEFYTMYDGDDLDETFVGQVGECIQKLEVNEGNLQSDPYIEGTLSGVKGDDRPLFLMTDATYSGFFTAKTKELLFVDDVNWSSSNSGIASVSSDGNVTAKECGSATITAQAKNGASASAEFTVEHVLQKVPAVEATCTEAGNIEYWSCENCGKLFGDSEGTQEISQAETVVAAGHDLSKTEAKAATCTETGLTEGIVCSVCGEVFVPQQTIKAIGHNWDEGIVTKEATCTEDGVRTFTCANDSTHTRTEVIPAGHTYGAWVTIRAATLHETGISERKCTVCGSAQRVQSARKTVETIQVASVKDIPDQVFTGKAITPALQVLDGTFSLKEGTDYTVSCENNINAGTAKITIKGIGSYQDTLTKSFKILPASIGGATISGLAARTYTGKAQTQTPAVTLNSVTLKAGTDYSVSYKNNTNAGSATVTVTGKGNYTGTKSASFTINKAAQSITAKAAASSIAVGKTTTVSITDAKGTKSYTSSDTSIATVDKTTGKVTAKKVGTVKITAASAAAANYNKASKTVTIKVVPAATSTITAANQATGIRLTWKKVAGATGYKVYRGSTLITTIRSGSTVTCTDTKANTNGAKYTFKIVPTASTGNGTAKSLTAYRVARPAISSVKNSASKKMTVKWGKNAKATGYQIQYSTSKAFASGNKTAGVTKAATVSKVIGSLTKGKTYYVRIRTYRTVGSKKYWSAWSAAKSVKIAK